MKISTKVILVTVIGLIVGVSLVCVGFLFDPFSLPFQDYQQMPLEAQRAYETRSALMQSVRFSGCGLAIVALLTIPITRLMGRNKISQEAK
jgi:ABC-type Fe3+ transport system permease subunit